MRSPLPPDALPLLGNAVKEGHSVERHLQNEFPCPCRPPQGRLGIPHPLTGANHAPQYVGHSRPGSLKRAIEASLGARLLLRSVELRSPCLPPG